MVSKGYFSIYSSSIKFSFQKHVCKYLKGVNLRKNVKQIIEVVVEGLKFGKPDTTQFQTRPHLDVFSAFPGLKLGGE